LTAAVCNAPHAEEITQRYQALLKHNVLTGRKTQPESSNENGDVEQRNYGFKKAVEQALLLGSLDFATREEYRLFLRGSSAG
jgi:hypothetical protein